MKHKCRLLLARHGQTEWNLEKRYQGSLDIPLSEFGKEQAKLLGNSLYSTPLRAIYSSHLIRAVETAELIAAPRGLSVIQDPNLREGHFGSNEGKTLDEVWEKFTEQFHYLSRLFGPARLHHKLTPDQESDIEVIARSVSALELIGQRHRGNVLVISHGGVMRLLLHYLAGIDYWNVHIENAKLYHFTYDSRGLRFAGRA